MMHLSGETMVKGLEIVLQRYKLIQEFFEQCYTSLPHEK